ncbi:MAG: hypothetical protein PWQ82_1809 [Thermosediminibacterales bacterium]|nr:hypothetical protein [Thermosediminibacterales bacterium]MDK2836741.1 hypothetical protein [Thermosediminibacterales bacterium]
MFSGLRWKISVTYLLIIILVEGLSGIFLDRSITNYYINNAKIGYFTQANILANVLSESFKKNSEDPDTIVKEYGRQIDGRVLYLDKNGKVVADSFDTMEFEGATIKHQEVLSALRGEGDARIHYLPGDGWVMYVSVPVLLFHRVVGAVLLSVSIGSVVRSLTAIRFQLFIISVIIGISVMILSMFFAGVLTKPIKQLTIAAKRVAKGNLRTRVEINSRDELGQLAEAFNTMGEELERYDQNQKKFIANASHELRSPLSSIKVLVESLINDNSSNISLYKEFLSDIDNEITRLSQLVNDLLDLARMDKIRNINRERVYIRELAEHVLDGIFPLAKSKGVKLSLKNNIRKDGFLLDKERISQMLWNLLDNAVKYTPEGGRVEINLYETNKDLVIEVSDTGIGIPEEEIDRIFKRFTRVDRARSRDSGGTGLGLALVKEIVNLHKGKIYVKSQLKMGSTFTVYLPKHWEAHKK